MQYNIFHFVCIHIHWVGFNYIYYVFCALACGGADFRDSEFVYSVYFFIGICFCLLFCLVCYCSFVVCNWEVGALGV